MLLTLPTPTPTNQERSVVPACLQARAPLSYEIRDEHDRRIAPTLAGYKLRRGKTYHMKVRTQEKSARNWKLRLLAPRSLLDVSTPDEVDGDARSVTFHIMAPPLGEWWNWFRSRVVQVPVHLDFEDGREPYRFEIPVVLLSSRLRRIGFFLLSAGASYLVEAAYHDRFAVPGLLTLSVCVGIGVLTVLGCIVLDQRSFYRQAVRAMKRREEQNSARRTDGTAEHGCEE